MTGIVEVKMEGIEEDSKQMEIQILENNIGEIEDKIKGIEDKIKGIEDKILQVDNSIKATQEDK